MKTVIWFVRSFILRRDMVAQERRYKKNRGSGNVDMEKDGAHFVGRIRKQIKKS